MAVPTPSPSGIPPAPFASTISYSASSLALEGARGRSAQEGQLTFAASTLTKIIQVGAYVLKYAAIAQLPTLPILKVWNCVRTISRSST